MSIKSNLLDFEMSAAVIADVIEGQITPPFNAKLLLAIRAYALPTRDRFGFGRHREEQNDAENKKPGYQNKMKNRNED